MKRAAEELCVTPSALSQLPKVWKVNSARRCSGATTARSR